MARSKEATRKAKAAYSRRYRKEHPEKVLAYNRRTIEERSARNKARRKLVEAGVSVRGKDVHHKNGNPEDNSKGNLVATVRHHEGGAPGNQNARKRRRRK